VTLWLLRGIAFVQLAMLAFQPVLAGLFLDGELDAIAVHGLSGSLLVLTDMAQVVAALLYFLAGRGKLWPLLLTAGMWLPLGIQIGMGHSRNMLVHIPLGVTLIVLQVVLFVWLCGKSARQPRTWGRRSGPPRDIPDV
jgi:hypothetical protein